MGADTGVTLPPLAYCSFSVVGTVITGSRADRESCKRRVKYNCEAFLYVCEQSFDGEREDEEEERSCDWEDANEDPSSAMVIEREQPCSFRGDRSR